MVLNKESIIEVLKDSHCGNINCIDCPLLHQDKYKRCIDVYEASKYIWLKEFGNLEELMEILL